MMIPERIKYILFDMDDVLVRTRPLDREIKEKLFGSLGLTWEQILPYTHLSMKELVSTLFLIYKLNQDTDEYIELYFKQYNQLLAERLEFNKVPGVVELIQQLFEKNYTLALVTSSTLAQAQIVIQGLKVADKFKVIITANDTSHSKPHPEPYQKAVDDLGALPKQCVVIEDLPTGIASAKAVSLEVFVIAITTTCTREELAAAGVVPDIIIDSFTEVEV